MNLYDADQLLVCAPACLISGAPERQLSSLRAQTLSDLYEYHIGSHAEHDHLVLWY